MSLHDDLLDQGLSLVGRGDRRPRQADLRRSVSAAYYAIFHFLIDRSCRQIFGAHINQQSVRRAFARNYEHSRMKRCCEFFANPKNAKHLESVLGETVNDEVRDIAGLFVTLQADRHRADYDLRKPFYRNGCDKLIKETRATIGRFDRMQKTLSKTLFLASLLPGASALNKL